MALVLTYNSDLGRVEAVASGFGAGTVRGELVRFDAGALTNAETVRGGIFDPLAPADTARVSDYEYAPGELNTYRFTTYNISDAVVTTFTQTITPDNTSTWVKSPVRPFLNRTVTVLDFGEVSAPARGGVFEIKGRRLPIAVTEVRGSRRFTLELAAATQTEAEEIERVLAFGDVLYLQPAAGCPVPGPLYAQVGDLTTARRSLRGPRRYLTLPLIEVAAPAAEVVGYTIDWAGVVDTWATWADVQTDSASWLALMQYVADPADVIVG